MSLEVSQVCPPHDFRPIFTGAGAWVTSLNHQAAALYCVVANFPCQSFDLVLDMDDKPVERISINLDAAWAQYVTSEEKSSMGVLGRMWKGTRWTSAKAATPPSSASAIQGASSVVA